MSHITPTTYEEFIELAKRGTVVPVVKPIMADLLNQSAVVDAGLGHDLGAPASSRVATACTSALQERSLGRIDLSGQTDGLELSGSVPGSIPSPPAAADRS